jgi:hypothetical protein
MHDHHLLVIIGVCVLVGTVAASRLPECNFTELDLELATKFSDYVPVCQHVFQLGTGVCTSEPRLVREHIARVRNDPVLMRGLVRYDMPQKGIEHYYWRGSVSNVIRWASAYRVALEFSDFRGRHNEEEAARLRGFCFTEGVYGPGWRAFEREMNVFESFDDDEDDGDSEEDI